MTDQRLHPLAASLRSGVRQLVSRPIYLLAMVAIPLVFTWFFLNLMSSGLPEQSPVAVVDLDNTPVSRNVVRNLNTSQNVSVDYKVNDYSSAMNLLKEGKIYGFFMIPRDFEADAVAGRETAITFYCNMAYFIPGTLSFKSFKQTAVTSSGGLVATTLVSAGVNGELVSNLLQPVVPQTHSIGNPWMSYTIYLGNSFLPCLLQLIIFQMTVFTLLEGIKRGTSDRELELAGGSPLYYMLGKLIPQFVIFLTVGLLIQSILYGYEHFPLNGSPWAMVGAMVLLVMASQAFGVVVATALPNLRFALSVTSLIGILAFSLAGFSYPVEDMYPAIGVFAYILPIRYYFLIYINVALNGYEVYYCWQDFVALMVFTILPFFGLPHLRKHWAKPVYLP